MTRWVQLTEGRKPGALPQSSEPLAAEEREELDLHSRRVVGWAMSDRIDRHLVLGALAMAVVNRGVPEGGVLHHSDRGSQYASEDYHKALEGHGFTASMSRKDNCWDNAVSESFFATIKTEMIHHQKFATRQEAKTAIFEYIGVFYHHRGGRHLRGGQQGRRALAGRRRP